MEILIISISLVLLHMSFNKTFDDLSYKRMLWQGVKMSLNETVADLGFSWHKDSSTPVMWFTSGMGLGQYHTTRVDKSSVV